MGNYNSSHDHINDNPDNPIQSYDRWENRWFRNPQENANHITMDRNLRQHAIRQAVYKAFYTIRTNEVTAQEAFWVYKWVKALNLEFQVTEGIAGASTLLSLSIVMKPNFDALSRRNEGLTVDFWKEFIRRAVAAADMIPGNFFLSANRMEEGAMNNIRSFKRLLNILEQNIHTLTPVAWNSLSDALQITRQVFIERGVNLDEFITRNEDESTATPKFTERELLTFLSRHPILRESLSKAAGSILQSTLNLRDGAYSGIRKLNANDARMIGYILYLKAEVRKLADEIKTTLTEALQNPHKYVEYFLDVTEAVRADAFDEFLVSDSNAAERRREADRRAREAAEAAAAAGAAGGGGGGGGVVVPRRTGPADAERSGVRPGTAPSAAGGGSSSLMPLTCNFHDAQDHTTAQRVPTTSDSNPRKYIRINGEMVALDSFKQR